MDKDDWNIVHTLADEMNLTIAAEKLFISQPALTYRLKKIESELGATLFERNAKGLVLTKAGIEAVNYCNNMLREYDLVKEKIAAASGKRFFSLRVAISPAYTKFKFPSFLATYSKNNPDIAIFVETHKSTTCVNLLREKKVHIAIVRGNHEWNGGSVFLGNDTICLVSDHQIDKDKLPELPYIRYITDTGLTNSINEWWQEWYHEPPYVVMNVNDSEACRYMVSKGLGYSILPNRHRMDKNYSNLINVPLYHTDGNLLVRSSWMMYYKSAMRHPVIKDFITSFVEFNDKDFVN